MKAPDNNYDRFTPVERIALVFEALGRQDYIEADRLVGTCAEKYYRMTETAYSMGMSAIHDCCMHALLLIAEDSGRVMAYVGMLVATANSRQRSMRKQFSEAEKAYIHALGKVFGHWTAWQKFCSEVGVDPEAVVRASWGDVPPCVAVCHPLLINGLIVPDPEIMAQTLGLFRAEWKGHIERCS